MDSLREEIIETHKARAEFLKWKVILVAAIGSLAFGYANGGGSRHYMLLALMPLVCIYVDVVARHLNMRIEVISAFICSDHYAKASAKDVLLFEYEKFCGNNRQAFSFESSAYRWASVIVALFVLAFVLWGSCAPEERFFMVASAIFGIVGVMVIEEKYKRKKRAIA